MTELNAKSAANGRTELALSIHRTGKQRASLESGASESKLRIKMYKRLRSHLHLQKWVKTEARVDWGKLLGR